MKTLLKKLSFGPLMFLLTAAFSGKECLIQVENSTQCKIISGTAVVV
jgi:hypothetical protein